jgi:ADP-heptose:LPS heptosyltransferase
MMAITKSEQFDFYSLQLPLATDHKQTLLDYKVTDLEQELVSYAHSGALVQQMDMVVSVCTSVVHLSGALNIPSLVLLSPHADWRWLTNEKQSTWYPNTAILRQETSGDWASLIDRASTYLDEHFAR